MPPTRRKIPAEADDNRRGVHINARLPNDLWEELDRRAKRHRLTFTDALRRYLTLGLDYRVVAHAGGEEVVSLHQTMQDITRQAGQEIGPQWYRDPDSFEVIKARLVAVIDLYNPEAK